MKLTSKDIRNMRFNPQTNIATDSKIQRIRHLLNEKSLSFLIGAGFSCNMSTHFVDWARLLSPMVKEMYGVHTEEDIQRKISEIGYLGIASEYVRRKGYHEAIDVYIEERTPIIKRREDNPQQYEVWLNGKLMGEADPTCHELLINLQAKHIFTFNYDNCLDIVGYTDDSQKLLNEIWLLRHKLTILKFFQNNHTNFIERNNSTISKKDSTNFVGQEYDHSIQEYAELISNAKQKNTELGNLSSDFGHNRDNSRVVSELIISIESSIKSLEKRRSDHYQLVSAAHMLSLTDNKRNIYKLHGTIRKEADSLYGFDGDSHCHYIITEEDYKDYPDKHEPFVNFMKVSLLKGAFCIIGFSCDDPNFLSWISWVKAVIDKNSEIREELSKTESARLFYIHSGDKALTPDKRLLLKNHYIEIVELNSILESTDHKSQLISFLQNITPSSSHFPHIKKSWNDINKRLSQCRNSNNSCDYSDISSDIEYVFSCRDINRIPSQQNIDHHNRYHILSELYFKYKKDFSQVSTSDLKLVISALREEMLLITHFFEYKDISIISEDIDKTVSEIFSDMVGKASVLEHTLTNIECVSLHAKIWWHLVNLNFKDAKTTLKSWQPSSTDAVNQVRKMMFDTIFGEIAPDRITSFSNQDLYHSSQDYLNALTLIPAANNTFLFEKGGGMKNSIDYSQEIKQLKANCLYLQSFEEIVNTLINEIRKSKPCAFGNTGKSITFGGNNLKLINSFKVLSIFYELCRPLCVNNITFFPEEKWAIIAENLIEEYPYPVLFYTFQYGSQKLVKRITQKLLYCNNQYHELPNIVSTMFRALRQSECPAQYRISIMQSLPILLHGVNPDKWGSDFIHFFRGLENVVRRYDDRNFKHEDYYSLVMAGLSLITDNDFKIETIADIISSHGQIDNWANQLIISAISNLREDEIIKSPFAQKLKEGLQWLCENASRPAHVYVVLNLAKFLDKGIVQQALGRLPDTLIESDCTLLEAIPRYICSDSSLGNHIKELVLNSKYLWSNGISDEGLSVGGPHLAISDISKFLKFSDTQLMKIWDKMIISFCEIQNRYKRDYRNENRSFFFGHFTGILDEMKSFVENNVFSQISDAQKSDIVKEIIKLRIAIDSPQSCNILDMLVNDDTAGAINILSENDSKIIFTQYQNELILIFNKLIFRHSQHLDSCITYLSSLIETYYEIMPKDIFLPLMGCLLNAYIPYYNGELSWDILSAQKDKFEKRLVKINNAFEKMGKRNDFWHSYTPHYYF